MERSRALPDERQAIQALRDEWDHAVPVAGGPSPYASWLEQEVVRLRRQHAGAVCFTEAELAEVEWSLRQRLDAWDDPDRKAKAATERAHRKVLDRIGGR